MNKNFNLFTFFLLGIFLLMISCEEKKEIESKKKSFFATDNVTIGESSPDINQITSDERMILQGVGEDGKGHRNNILLFNFNGISRKNIIDSAYLVLYPFNDSGSNINGNNSYSISVFDGKADPKIITWNNHPEADLNKVIYVQKSKIKDIGENKISIKKLITDDNNHFDVSIKNGLMLSLLHPEDKNAVFNFKSALAANKEKRPKIMVYYH